MKESEPQKRANINFPKSVPEHTSFASKRYIYKLLAKKNIVVQENDAKDQQIWKNRSFAQF